MLTRTQTLGKFPLALSMGQRLNAPMRACAAWATIEEHDKILDMACGDGALLNYLNDRYRLTLCGMCESPEQARAVREMLGDADVMYAQMEDIPWREEAFDVLLLPTSVRGDTRRVLDEAFRVLKRGGQLVVAASMFHFKMDGEMSRREMMRLMQEAGFGDVSFRISGLYGTIIGWKKPDFHN